MYLVCVCVTPKRNGITREISTKYEHFTGVIVKVAVVVPVKSLGLWIVFNTRVTPLLIDARTNDVTSKTTLRIEKKMTNIIK